MILNSALETFIDSVEMLQLNHVKPGFFQKYKDRQDVKNILQESDRMIANSIGGYLES